MYESRLPSRAKAYLQASLRSSGLGRMAGPWKFGLEHATEIPTGTFRGPSSPRRAARHPRPGSPEYASDPRKVIVNSHTRHIKVSDGRLGTHPRASDRAVSIDRDKHYFEALFENASDAILVLSETARFIDANPAACQLIGLTRDELIGRSVSETIETGTDFDSAWRKFSRDGKYRGQRWLVRPDGARRLIEIIARADILPGHHLALWRDVTDRYFLESELVQRERDEALARLSGGIAHRLTNLLSVIAGHTELMTREITPNPDFERHTERILTSTKQAAALTAGLSALGRQQVLSPALLDLSTFVQGCGGTLRSIVPENVDLVLPETKKSAPIRVDRTQMALVIFTLASTAGELMPHGGRLTVSVRNGTVSPPLARSGFQIPAGQYVILELRAEAGEQRPLFSPQWRGVGPALPAVTATVKESNGFLWIGGDGRESATFSIYFAPVVGPTLTGPESSLERLRGSETILLVEDDPGMRETTREYLEYLGYRVLQAGNGEEALKAAQSAGWIDVLIADLRMPKMGGEELAKKMSLAMPGIKVMFVSGNIDRAFIHRLPGQRGIAVLSKPFEMRALAAALRDLLDGKTR